MRRFTRLYLDLDATNATSEKVALLEAYLRRTPPEDAAWAVGLLTGERPKGGASTRVLRSLVEEVSGLPGWLIDECYASVGDLSETVALLLPGQGAGADEPLHETMNERVVPLASADERERARIITRAWEDFGPDERFVFHKLIRGGFRVGVQKKLVARALASVAGVTAQEMTHRLVGAFRPEADWYDALLSGEGATDTHAYPFFLAHQLTGDVEDLGDVREWAAEWKWDGARAQLIRRSAVELWSRGEEPLTEQFPEIVSAARALGEGTVLDGELLIWRGDRPLGFDALQKRLGRKVAPTAQRGLFDRDEAAFLAFDLLEHEGTDVRERAFDQRRELLERVVHSLDGDAIRTSPMIDASSWEELGELRSESRDRAVEGLMLKRRSSAYGVGRTKAGGETGWWKWKVDPYSVDAVLVYAQPGTGRRASLLTDYTFAVWEGDELSVFAKAYSGLDNDEIEALDAWIRRHTLRKTGPVHHVEPTRVFEIHFEGIGASERHKSGIAVRFPRIARERTDKKAADADTIDALRALLRPSGERP